MIKDLLLKLVFIPVLGFCLPLVAGIITYDRYSIFELVCANVFFILTSLAIWEGCNWIHWKLRPLYRPIESPFSKIAAVVAVSALYGACTGALGALAWMKISREEFNTAGVYKFVAACVAAVVMFTLIYEILFLSKERELDTQIVDQLDKERSQAELQALTNEMDPHFIFNSLNTLNHLIVNQPREAHSFNNRLAQVYKYFLINKNKELIPLSEELDFIESYFYLLQIRHDDKLEMQTVLNDGSRQVLIPPCSLQILIENAVKHNEFTSENPLKIKVVVNEHYLKVTNNVKPKPYAVHSTGIGLRNLSSRYRILFQRDIQIETTRDLFTVKLPFIT